MPRRLQRILLRPVALALSCGLVLSLGCDSPSEGDDDASSPDSGESPTPSASTPTPSDTPTPSPTPTPAPTPKPKPFAVIGSTPNQGAMAVPRTTSFTLSFSQPFTAPTSTASASVTNETTGETLLLANPTVSKDALSITWFTPCWGDDGVSDCALDRDTGYTFHAVLSESQAQEIPPVQWPIDYTALFTTRVPCGVSFNIALDVAIQQLGESDSESQLVKAINTALRASTLYPVALIYDNVLTTATFPLEDVLIASGLATESEDIYEIDDDSGLPVTMTGCRIDDAGNGVGAFSCGPQNFVFPIPITDDTVLSLYFTDAVVTGDLSYAGSISALTGFVLTGVITYEDLVRLFTEAGLTGFVDAIQLDQDLDGDGVNDAATAIATSNPLWINIDGCDPSK